MPTSRQADFSATQLAVLRAIHDSILNEVCEKLTGENQRRVQEAVASAIMEMAKAGQFDPEQLRAHGLRRALAVLA